MDGHTLTAPSDISAAARLAVLVRRTRQMRLRDGCRKWDTWVYRGANRTGTGLPEQLDQPVSSGLSRRQYHAPQGSQPRDRVHLPRMGVMHTNGRAPVVHHRPLHHGMSSRAAERASARCYTDSRAVCGGRGVDAASGTEEAGWAWRRRNVSGRIYRGERDQSGRGYVRTKRMRGRIARPGGAGPGGAGRPGRAGRAGQELDGPAGSTGGGSTAASGGSTGAGSTGGSTGGAGLGGRGRARGTG